MDKPVIRLPFPPASLSGHNAGGWWAKSKTVSSWRGWAHYATKEAKVPPPPPEGDIPVLVRFYPPDRRSDATNYGNRCKPIFDGIADALKVNDRRFRPQYEYHEPEKPGRVEIVVG